jgi:DNA invertase Pin-like site-specific DNA recombinase
VYIAIYARISTIKQDNLNQLDQLRDFAATQGWNISKEYVDVATGKNGDREQFKALFDAASRREFELVLFWSLDRFSREGVLETLQYLQRLTAYGVGYRSFTEQYLDSCGMFRDAVISILAVIAKQERVRLSERTLAGLAVARARGRVGGRPRLQCDRRKVMKLHAAGNSLGSIAKQLRLTKTTVYRIVHAKERQAGSECRHPQRG